ncbi:MAG: alpha/beta fold hydrolase, partial [Bacteroidota bacterium]|nr:alpha/beta fold hydrolase [Bacteroidota bacterium]MDX5431267.1 alpha/beta fold hydrolase [Bacteroidota bacterium]MDX5470006.1 alpha/beta fold hydrolase [Bacteroidota bacterium]
DSALRASSYKFLAHLIASEVDSAHAQFSSKVQEKLHPADLHMVWRQISGSPTLGNYLDTQGFLIEGNTIFLELHFEKGNLDLKLPFNSTGQFTGIFFAPAKDKSPYPIPTYVNLSKVKSIPFTLRSGRYSLEGELCLPVSGKGPYPLVVLSPGSGPMSMDAQVGPNRIFKDIAFGLATEGVAVFRFHKRTYVYGKQSAPDFEKLTLKEEYIDDLIAAFDTLKTYPGLDTHRFYLFGHSLGAATAPRVANQVQGLKGIIMAAAPFQPLDSMVLRQFQFLNSLDSSGTYYRALKDYESEIEFLRSEEFDTTADASWLPLSLNAFYWDDLFKHPTQGDFLLYDGKCLLLFGTDDYQVPLTEANAWKAYCREHKKGKVIVFDGLSHSFTPSEGKQGPAQYQDYHEVDYRVIQAVRKFIR